MYLATPTQQLTPFGLQNSRLAFSSLALLAPPGDRGYIPYRDSKLTRLLQPSLGGNAKITIICTVTGALLSSDETHNTLKFANRAKRMKNHAAINEVSNEKVRCWEERLAWVGKPVRLIFSFPPFSGLRFARVGRLMPEERAASIRRRLFAFACVLA